MKDKLKGMLIALAAVVALGAGGAAIAGATGGGESGADDQQSEKPISGSALDQASATALKEVGEGKVTQTEAGDEEGAYEVEVTKADGSQVDVHLDKQFKVLNAKADEEEPASGDVDGETNDGQGN